MLLGKLLLFQKTKLSKVKIKISKLVQQLEVIAISFMNLRYKEWQI